MQLAVLAAVWLTAWAAPVAAQMNYPAEIAKTTALLKENPASQINRVRLATLYYLHGAEQAGAGKHMAAIDSYRTGLNTLQRREYAIPRTNTAYQALWYGLGYSYHAIGQHERAIATLEQLTGTFPKLLKGRYLLGIAQVQSSDPARIVRGIDALARLAQEDTGPIGQASRRAAAGWALSYGTVLASEGKAAEAVRLMLMLNPTGHVEGAANREEQQALLYGAGYFKQQAGNLTDAIADFEALKEINPGFKLRNGITLQVVLSNAYYEGALQQLQESGQEALKLAVEYFDLAEKTGNPKAADVNYGKAVAYLKLGKGHEQDVARELELVAQKDPVLFARVNRAR
jgi:tetratricopeptide (TPR) repeat protein